MATLIGQNTKDEIILVSPGPTGYLLRNTIASYYGMPKKRPSALNIIMLAGPLKKAGFKIKILDGRDENMYKIKSYITKNTLFVGISTNTSYQIMFSLKTAKMIRKIDPRIPIAWGGLHPTVLPEGTLKNEYVDIACVGEGDKTVVDLALALKNNLPLETVKGIAYKEKGQIHVTPKQDFINMDELEYDYSMLNPKIVDMSLISYQTSRGCPNRCKFCEVGPMHGRRYRIRNIEKVVDDIEIVSREYNTKRIDFVDENFFTTVSRGKRYAELIAKKNIRFIWHVQARADFFRKTDVSFWKQMKQAGCDFVLLGGESGSQKMLNSMRKDITVEDIFNAADQLSRANITGSYGFMSGIPEETMEDIKKTMKVANRLQQYKHIYLNGIFLLAVFPNTDYYFELQKKGVKFPERLKDWGSFLWGSKKYIKWHPHYEFAFRLTQVAKWTSKVPLSKVFKQLLRLDIPFFLFYLCGFISYYRWKHSFYAFPIDIYVQYWISKYVIKYLWW